jgi:hypothetical protein
MPLVGMISPQFVRRREDKAFHAADIPLRQVTDLVDVDLADRDARQLDLPKSELIRREVCTKQLKGQTMVRKLLMWKTNKDDLGEEFPAYVIHYTDFSPNRKTPLERDIRVSSSREQIELLWSDLTGEAFSKGWAPVSVATPTALSAAAIATAPVPTPVPTDVAVPEPKRRGRKAAESETAAADPHAVEPAPKPPTKRSAPRKKKPE